MSVSKGMRVGVLMGGMSTERDVSMKSGKAVLEALRVRGWDAVAVDVGPDLPARLVSQEVEVCWIALHGQFGEDGCVQGLLEIMRIPYTGTGVGGSAAAIDKVTTKRLLEDTAVSLPGDWIWRAGGDIPEGITYPVVAKTPEGGSTLGIEICASEAELEAALPRLASFDEEVLLEAFVDGTEITVAVLDGEPLPVVAILPESGFFDFEAKYTKGATRYVVPAELPAEVTAQAQRDAVIAFKTLGLWGIARADFIVNDDGIPMFLEVNTIPGMTATSLSPMAGISAGLDFEEIVERVLLGARLQIVRRDEPGGPE